MNERANYLVGPIVTWTIGENYDDDKEDKDKEKADMVDRGESGVVEMEDA
jgi:hypothetical protein